MSSNHRGELSVSNTKRQSAVPIYNTNIGSLHASITQKESTNRVSEYFPNAITKGSSFGSHISSNDSKRTGDSGDIPGIDFSAPYRMTKSSHIVNSGSTRGTNISDMRRSVPGGESSEPRNGLPMSIHSKDSGNKPNKPPIFSFRQYSDNYNKYPYSNHKVSLEQIDEKYDDKADYDEDDAAKPLQPSFTDGNPTNQQSSESTIQQKVESKSYIEFTNNFSMYRLLRMVLYVQFIYILTDHPSMHITTIFKILSQGILLYTFRFYSRILIDIVYILQLFSSNIMNSVRSSSTSSTSRRLDSHTDDRFQRFNPSDIQLNNNSSIMSFTQSYAMTNTRRDNSGTDSPSIYIDFLDDKIFHSIKYYTDYFYGIIFIILILSFTLFYWEFYDFTDRKHVRDWLYDFVADGWWRRGGLKLLWGICKWYESQMKCR